MQRVQAADIGVGDNKLGQRARLRFGEGIFPSAALFYLRLPIGGKVAIKIEPLFARCALDLDAIEIANPPFGKDSIEGALRIIKAPFN